MADNSNDNILGSLKTLLWSAFIGVVSFQLLAPIVWDYLHAALGINYYLSYWIFTFVYFLILPVFILGWLWSRRKLISNYLPVYKGYLNYKSRFFLNGIFIFITLQFSITLHGFFTRWSDLTFYFVWSINALSCWMLLISCYSFCKLHINHIFPVKRSESRLYENAVYRSNAKKYLYHLFFPTVLVHLLLFSIAFLFINNWISENNKRHKNSNYNSAYDAGKRSFAFQELNDFVNSKSSELTSLEDAGREKYLNFRLDSAAGKIDSTFKAKSKLNQHDSLKSYLDNLKGWKKKLESLMNFHKRKPDLVKREHIINLKDSATFNLPMSLSVFIDTIATKDDMHFVELLKINLGATSSKITKVSKSELGIQLRAVQTKGMLMLISLFFTLLALYIFIKIINKVQTLELEQIKKQLKVGYAPAGNELQEEFETNVAESGKAGNALWLMLTATAWLLVPIFKIVKDEEINLGSPYKTPTFSGSSAGSLFSKSDNNVNSTSGKRDTFVIHTKFDTIKVSLVDGGGSKLDSPSIRTLLKEIKNKVNDVETKANLIKNKIYN